MVDETRTSSGAANDISRAAAWTATPRTSPPTNSTSPVWMAARIRRPRPWAERVIAPAHRTARVAPSKTARNPSPVVLTSRPRKLFRSLRRLMLWRRRRSFQAVSPIRWSMAVESTMSVKRTDATTRSPGPCGPMPTRCALVHSIVTHGSSPTTQASCPGGISKIESGGMSSDSPSSMRTCRTPETECPRWWTWQLGVPIVGARSTDHRQPGLQCDRPTVVSARLTTSACPLGKVRTSSGVAKLLNWSRGMREPFQIKRCGRWVGGMPPPTCTTFTRFPRPWLSP